MASQYNLTFVTYTQQETKRLVSIPSHSGCRLVVVRTQRAIWRLQFVDLEPDSLRGGLNLEGLDGWVADDLGDPIGQVLIDRSEHTHWEQTVAQFLHHEGHS